jgi:hypothetical protein
MGSGPGRRIRRPPKGRGKKRGVKPGTRRGRYNTSTSRTVLDCPWVGAPAYASISEAPRAYQLRAAERAEWVRRWVQEGCPRGMLMPYARAHAATLGLASEVPPEPTLRSWAMKYRVHGELGLIDRIPASAGTPQVRGGVPSITPAQQEAIINGLVGGQLGYAGLHRHTVELTPAGDPVPSYEVVLRTARRFERANPHLMTVSRQGMLGHRHLSRLSISHGLYPGGYRLAIDSTLADVWVRVPALHLPEGWAPTRVAFTSVIDVGSRLCLSFGLSQYALTPDIISGVFMRAIHQEMNYPGLPSTGMLPVQIAMDHGSEHRGRFRELLDLFGVEVVGRTPNSPTGGAHIESFIGTITKELFASMTGYTRTTKVVDVWKEEADSSARTLRAMKYEPYRLDWPVEALCTLEELDARICAWIQMYNDRPHPALSTGLPHVQEALSQFLSSDHQAA